MVVDHEDVPMSAIRNGGGDMCGGPRPSSLLAVRW